MSPADGYSIRSYRAEDEARIGDLWNLCLTRDEIALNTFRRKVVLDANFDAQGCFVAEGGGSPVGFLLSIRRRHPYYDLGLEPGRGWITVMFVHPEWRRRGIGKRLVGHAEAFLRHQGVCEVSVSDYTPNYFLPGVDLDAYGTCRLLLESCGYRKVQSVYGMGRSLVDFQTPSEIQERLNGLRGTGLSVSVFRPSHTLQLLEFLRRDYPGDLFNVARERLVQDPECDEILVALHDGQVIGFSHFQDEHFGPFGIAKEYTGRGFGLMLFYATVDQMRKKGRQNLWLAWTSGRAKDFYYRLGLRVKRRHVIMNKILSGPGPSP